MRPLETCTAYAGQSERENYYESHFDLMVPQNGQRDPCGSLDHALRTVVSVKHKHVYREECDRLFIAVLFVIEKKWKQANYHLSAGE